MHLSAWCPRIVSFLAAPCGPVVGGQMAMALTLGYSLHAAHPRNGGFIDAFFDAMALSAGSPDARRRHCNRLPDRIPRISDALQWTTDGPRLRMSLI